MIRLDKFLSQAGVASRRQLREIIRAGAVRIDGVCVTDYAYKFDETACTVTVNGETVREAGTLVVMMNKPAGYITATEDARKATVMELLPPELQGRQLKPIGRLDKETEGLLLFTNDGEFANAMTHPYRHISKTYRVSVRPKITEDQLTVLTSSLMIDGRKTLPADVRIVSSEEDKSVLEIVLYEGRNRQIRRLCEEAGLETVRLKRVAIGQLKLSGLKRGEYRHLTHDEVSLLKRQSGNF